MIWLTVMMIDMSAIAGCTFLAYHFNHWWIILFALLFMVRARKGDDNDE